MTQINALKNRSKYFAKGKVFVQKKWGSLVKIVDYFPQTSSSAEKVQYEEINPINSEYPKKGQCFGDIMKYLYDINTEIDNYGK